MVGRPRLYELPDFERFLVDGARTNRRMARVYTQQVCKLLALVPRDPCEADVRAAIVQVQSGRGRDTKAAWNAYVELQAKLGVRLPTIAKTPRMMKLTDAQRAMATDMQSMITATGATLRELINLRAADLRFYKVSANDQLLTVWDVEVSFRNGAVHSAAIRSAKSDPLMQRLWGSHVIAYSQSKRDVRVFNGFDAWDDWCVFAASAGLKFAAVQCETIIGGLTETHWDHCLHTWLTNVDMSWNELQQMIWDVPDAPAESEHT